MDELKRYALSSAGRVFPDPDGNWVFHESARAALDSLKAHLATEREAHEKALAESEARYVAQTDALLKVEREAHARTLAALEGVAITSRGFDSHRCWCGDEEHICQGTSRCKAARAAIAAAKVTP